MGYRDKNSGKLYTQREINQNINKACRELKEEMFEEHGRLFCHLCKESYEKDGTYKTGFESQIIDCSHNKSRRECKNDGEIEKLWDKDNLELICTLCHREKDKLNLQFTKKE